MDLSIKKEKRENIFIYELQPLVNSGLGLADNGSRLIPAFEKAFPGFSFELDYEETHYPPKKSTVTKVFFSDRPPQENSKYKSIHKYFIDIGDFQLPKKKPNDNEKYYISLNASGKNLKYSPEKPTKNKKILISDKFLNGIQGQNFNRYRYIHAPEASVLSRIGNKVNQRLYLPSEVSPPYVLFDLSLDIDREIKRVQEYFREKGIDKIVLKHPQSCMGDGNIFIDSIQNEAAIKQGIEKLSKNPSIDNLSYLLVESQSAFPRVSRKTGEIKSGYTTYRIVGIADENGILGYFIASKSISSGVDSHQRNILKLYFNGKRIVNDEYCNWISQHCKPKDKYFNLGSNRIVIDSTLLEKVFKSAYRLYRDAQIMTANEFKAHIDSLIKKENSGLNIAQLKTKGLYESFISQFKALNLNDKIMVKGTIKQDKLNIYLLTPEPSSEICLFLEKLALKIKDITIKNDPRIQKLHFPTI
ncbi:hypothetical protein FQR65_LT11302 [Abscondita terminalis]|nr:hypothetical protein FQR65_LT11302 [Abscondita terminalis]